MVFIIYSVSNASFWVYFKFMIYASNWYSSISRYKVGIKKIRCWKEVLTFISLKFHYNLELQVTKATKEYKDILILMLWVSKRLSSELLSFSEPSFMFGHFSSLSCRAICCYLKQEEGNRLTVTKRSKFRTKNQKNYVFDSSRGLW